MVSVMLLSSVLAILGFAVPASATVTELLRLNSCSSNGAFLLVDDPTDDAADALNPMNPSPTWGSNVDYGLDDNLFDGTPGCVYWGNTTSDTSGTFGTARLLLGLTDIVSTTGDYWSIDVSVGSRVLGGALPYNSGDSSVNVADSQFLSVNAGFRAVVSGQFHYGTSTPVIAVDTSSTPVETHCQPCSFFNIMDDNAGRPWSTAEIEAGYLFIDLRFDSNAWGTFTYWDTPISLVICWIVVQIQSETYSVPALTDDSFVLRPDGDWTNTNWWGHTDTVELWDNLNETNYHSDNDISYVQSAWTNYTVYGNSFEDPPETVDPTGYFYISIWVIAKETIAQTDSDLTIYTVIPNYDVYTNDTKPFLGMSYDAETTTSFSNFSRSFSTYSGDFVMPFRSFVTYAELLMISTLYSVAYTTATPTGYARISQVALLCTPMTPTIVPDDDGGESPGFDDMFDWLGRGGGIMSLFGLFGLCFMVLGPTVMYLKYESGDDAMLAIGLGLIIAIMGLGMFWAGLAGHWG